MTAPYSSTRTNRMNKRAAEGRLSWKFRVQTYVRDHYAEHQAPLCIEDIRVALKAKSNVIKNAIATLILRGNLRCVGYAENAGRHDLGVKTKMYAPATAPLLAAFVAESAADEATVTAGARKAADKRYLLNTEPPKNSPYLGKPAALREPRIKSEPYVGAVGEKYAPERLPNSRRSEDYWLHRDLALTQR